MAKPITSMPPFSGKAADWLIDYIENAKRDPKKEAQARQDEEIVAQMKKRD